jgi:large subunit ribosomal protein L4
MISVAVYNREGKEVDTVKVDEAVLGGKVNYILLKQAIVMYHANKRVGTAATKNKSLVEGSTRKLYRQKGTGNARVGQVRTAKRVGGGVTFEKKPRDFSRKMPKKQRRLAAGSAVLEKLLNNNLLLLDDLKMEKPRTSEFADILNNLKINRSCLVMIVALDENICKSVRNIPKVSVMPVSQINAGDVCNHVKLLFTKEAFLTLLGMGSQAEN